ncbi:hypothetical protein NDU88_005008 [Pleurodeles waltl]|uniref:Uncharacterized protein n=1 Tax=Pleurodeles waltl TaxID=8319 RepID=A0AAV7VKI2_PLEWA|nr:hypothetical protein NDU88_005008 [Pleurodeles waltl]
MVVPQGGRSRVGVAPPAAVASVERQTNQAQLERVGALRGNVVVHPRGKMDDTQTRDLGGALPAESLAQMDNLDYEEDTMEEGELREGVEDEWWCVKGSV